VFQSDQRLVDLLLEAGEHEEALYVAEVVLPELDAVIGAGGPDLADRRTPLVIARARAQVGLGAEEDALASFEEAIASYERQLVDGREELRLASVLARSARLDLLEALGRAEEATTGRAALVAELELVSAGHQGLNFALLVQRDLLVRDLLGQARDEEALPHAERSIEGFRAYRAQVGRAAELHIRIAEEWRARCLARVGRTEDALAQSDVVIAGMRPLVRDGLCEEEQLASALRMRAQLRRELGGLAREAGAGENEGEAGTLAEAPASQIVPLEDVLGT
jgi:hypothetical protein